MLSCCNNYKTCLFLAVNPGNTMQPDCTEDPGTPLTYFNDGEVRVIFLGLKFWAKVIFWVYERRRDFFGSRKKDRGIFGVAKKGLRDFLGYARKSSNFFG